MEGRKEVAAQITNFCLMTSWRRSLSLSQLTQNTGARIDLKDPRGIPVSVGKTSLAKGAIFEIDYPRPGSWKLIVSSGAGKHSYVIKA